MVHNIYFEVIWTNKKCPPLHWFLDEMTERISLEIIRGRSQNILKIKLSKVSKWILIILAKIYLTHSKPYDTLTHS